MNSLQIYLGIAIYFLCTTMGASQEAIHLEAVLDNWSVFNRQVDFDHGVAHLDGQESDGMIIHKTHQFANGTIEFDVKGKDLRGRSFVGFAFHHINPSSFDAIYFRPFNFFNPKKKSNSVQYISVPEYGWSMLRKNYPGQFEGTMYPLPESAEDWFHVKIEVNHPSVKVYVNDSDQPVLDIIQKSKYKKGNVGFWVGNNSEGWFKNLKITDSNLKSDD